jgi:hypothetical protein
MHSLNARGLTFHGPALNGQSTVRFTAPSSSSFTFGNSVQLEANRKLKTADGLDVSALADVVADLVPAPTAQADFLENQKGFVEVDFTADQQHTHVRYAMVDKDTVPLQEQITDRADLEKGATITLRFELDAGSYDFYYYLVSDATNKESAVAAELGLAVT